MLACKRRRALWAPFPGGGPLVDYQRVGVFAARQIGAGEHDGLVIAVALAGWWRAAALCRAAGDRRAGVGG